jgi:hypothetical protein
MTSELLSSGDSERVRARSREREHPSKAHLSKAFSPGLYFLIAIPVWTYQ